MPPVAAVAVILPDPATHVTFVTELMPIPKGDDGWVIVADALALQPWLSLTVIV